MKKPLIHLSPFLFQPNVGPPFEAEWGYLFIPENRKDDSSRSISLPFIRFPASTIDSNPPIVYLHGGPGVPILSFLDHIWSNPFNKSLTTIGDVIFVEQRGVGRSRPRLDCPGEYNIPFGEIGSETSYREGQHRYLSEAASYWLDQGIDLAGYNVIEMAADIDDLRKALGYEKISLLGGSFGSHHGLAVMREYGQAIHRAFLLGIEGPNHTLKLPSNIQIHLEKLGGLVQRNNNFITSISDLLCLIAEAIDLLNRKPIQIGIAHPLSGERINVVIGGYDLQLVTANGLGGTKFLRDLPVRYLEIERGDYSWLAAQVIKLRVNLQINLMFVLTDFASGATMARRAQITAEAQQTHLGNTINDLFLNFFDLFGDYDLGDNFREDYYSETPVMLVSGNLDARTPTSNADDLLPFLPNGQHLIIDGASHDLSWRGSHLTELASLRDRFLQGKSINPAPLQSNFAFAHHIDPDKSGV